MLLLREASPIVAVDCGPPALLRRTRTGRGVGSAHGALVPVGHYQCHDGDCVADVRGATQLATRRCSVEGGWMECGGAGRIGRGERRE